jgi:hypothetical protein
MTLYAQRNVDAWIAKVLRDRDADDPRFLELCDVESMARISVSATFGAGWTSEEFFMRATCAGTDFDGAAICTADLPSMIAGLRAIAAQWEWYVQGTRKVLHSMFVSTGYAIDATAPEGDR